jgi:hypothetical protein
MADFALARSLRAFALAFAVLGVAACGTSRPPLERGLFSPDTVVVVPVKNLSGVTLKVPEVYMGDVGGRIGFPADDVDLALLAEAAVFARMDELGYRVDFVQNAGRFREGVKYELHSAITRFDMTELRQTGRFRMAMIVMLVNKTTQVEVARGESEGEYQLMDMAPDESGALGEQRFIEGRLQIFTESLAREAVDAAGF